MILGKRICATIEARMTSSRLPGKVLLPLAGKPALQRLVERIRQSEYIDEVVVATTIHPTDDPIIELCEKNNIAYYRGSETDVLSRVLEAAQTYEADLIVEITGDCPLVEKSLINQVVEEFGTGKYDYVANNTLRTFPDGFDVQIFPTEVLAKVDTLTNDPIDRVHVSYYIYQHPEMFRLKNIAAEGKMLWGDLGITLDEKADYELINKIFETLIPQNEFFTAEQIVDLLRAKPDWVEINRHVRRKQAQEG